MKELKLALLGFGNAGRAFGRLLMDKHDEIKKEYDTDVKVVAIATGSRGNLYNPDGLDVALAIDDIESEGKFAAGRGLTDMSTIELVEKADYDVICEMTPLNPLCFQPF